MEPFDNRYDEEVESQALERPSRRPAIKASGQRERTLDCRDLPDGFGADAGVSTTLAAGANQRLRRAVR